MDLQFIHSVKINPELIITCEKGSIVVDIPSIHKRLEISKDTFTLLHLLSYENKELALKELEDEYSLDDLPSIINDLFDSYLLVKSDYQLDYPIKWERWKKTTWAFHLDSRNIVYASSHQQEMKTTQQIKKTPPPNIYKCDCKQTINTYKLPKPKEIEVESLTNIFFKRRTCRNFLDIEIDLDKLSTVLFYTGGALFEAETIHFGKILIKPVPSPGARHSTEIYIYVRKCEQIKEGIYHYCVKHHALNFVSDVEADFLKKAIYNQDYFEQAAAIFFFTSIVDRMMWKYKSTKAYRQLHFEIGHYCQNLLLTGTALNLGVFQTGAMYDSYIESYLHINGCDEFLMYCAGIGVEDPKIESIETAVPLHDFFDIQAIKLPKKSQRFKDVEI